MKGARLAVEVTPARAREGDDPALCIDGRRVGPTGWDRVALLIAANPGEEPRDLRQVASGGELSRVMLALRKGLGEHDPVPTVIYDEVDAGVGGAAADVVGRYLAQVSRHRQVLCVTHLPQVAAHADHHFHVGKQVANGRARTGLQALDNKARVEEVARMLGGEQVSRQARANARQLLLAARSEA
jgi:DNA repair protein RecN (Recombination protein N)